jgi:hypothetical protein
VREIPARRAKLIMVFLLGFNRHGHLNESLRTQ